MQRVRMVLVTLLLALCFLTDGLRAQPCDACIGKPVPNCRVGPESSVWTMGCRAEVTASWDGMSSPPRVGTCSATVPNGYMLRDIKVSVLSNNNGGMDVSRFAAGTDIEYRRVIDEAYQSALEVAGKIADPKERAEVEAKIKTEYKSRIELVEKIRTNMDSVRVNVTATPHGSPFDRKRGWMSVQVFMLVDCVAPSDLSEQIERDYGLNARTSGTSRTVRVENKHAGDGLLFWRVADRFTECSKSYGTVSAISIKRKEVAEIAIDPVLALCYAFGANASSTPIFADACRARFGETIDVTDKRQCRE